MSIAIRDNLSGGISRCNQITGFTVSVGFATAGTIKASWTNPTDIKYKGVRIMYKTGGYPTSPTDGSVFYDSNDATPVSTFTKTGFTDGTAYYLRAFAYTYKNATRLYTTTTTGAQASGTPVQIKGEQTFTSSGNFTAPAGVNSIDIFLVGGGGGGSYAGEKLVIGGGGGYTKTVKGVAVTPGASYPVVIGAGGAGGTTTGAVGGNGGDTTITINGTTHKASGGKGGGDYSVANTGNGGSGGGASGPQATQTGNPTGGIGGDGGTNGSNGYRTAKTAYDYLVSQNMSTAQYYVATLVEAGKTYSQGQGSTTRAFGDSAKTLYSGGGGSPSNGDTSNLWVGAGGAGGGGKGAGYGVASVAGTANTGGGGGTGSTRGSYKNGANGGSGILIIRWGY